ncbi:topoisomerase DNA-binding C4 zinc finger domain-containing protein [Vibrio sp. Of7-15]|uniref:DNA topoisomerase family protein n=1 Tax=Vibrio sp. Of7-15 TaxID=2724879 RepID=UPI001EF3922E|nr:topoisomerase DNA-binding C4 zinc finger domain-containing protein [Vibrio sp. Of7-15]MCG7499248.1 topoisomerase DNA-binding C4 zinc finger domain-containing protein [Vibrio sp. Of7-15]
MSGKIDEQLFGAHEHALEHHESCPSCGGELAIRHSKRGPFLGCTQYPACDYIRPLHHNDGHVVKELGLPCPSCSSELVLRQGRYGMFIGCSSFPECDHIEPLEQKKEEVETEAIDCPSCRPGRLVERKSRFGKIFYACDNYPSCRFAVNSQPIAGCCEECGFPLLIEKKTAKGIQSQCADRKCHHIQSQQA